MLSKLHGRLTYANVMATVAMFIALGGGAYAAASGSIGSRELKNNTVRSQDIRNNQVSTSDLRNNSASGRDIRNDTLTGGDVLESALGEVPKANQATTATTAGNTNQLGGVAASGYLRTSQLRAGRGDDTAVPASVILDYPQLGVRIETDGDADDDNSLVLRNTNTCSPCDINFVTSDSGGSDTAFPGASAPIAATNRVIDIVAARYTTSHPTRAIHLNCGFPIGSPTFCVGIDVEP
jgi:hypothetical protein